MRLYPLPDIDVSRWDKEKQEEQQQDLVNTQSSSWCTITKHTYCSLVRANADLLTMKDDMLVKSELIARQEQLIRKLTSDVHWLQKQREQLSKALMEAMEVMEENIRLKQENTKLLQQAAPLPFGKRRRV